MYKANMMDLKKYLETNSITQEGFAVMLEKEQATVSRLVSKKQLPSLETAVLIEKLTKGHVTASSWIKGAA